MLESKILESGLVPYAIVHPGIKKEYYYSLEGAFMTKPQFPPERVGLGRDANMSYIDFTIKEGHGVLSLEPGIFLIPGKPRFPKWIEDAYSKWKMSGKKEYPTEHQKIFKRIESYSNDPRLVVPMKIKSYKKNGVITNP